MSWNNKRFLGLAGMGGLLVLGGAARAQQAPRSPRERIDGDRGDRGKTLREHSGCPGRGHRRGREQLASEHVYSIADLARTTPSLEMVQAFGGPGGGGQIRGIGTNSFSPTAEGAVGIVVDGVPQGNVNVTNIFDMQASRGA